MNQDLHLIWILSYVERTWSVFTAVSYTHLDVYKRQAYTSSWWLVNGNFLRLKNLQFGYTIPKKILAKANIGLSNVRVYVAGTNLFTFTEFKYCDPEMAIINNGYYPQQKLSLIHISRRALIDVPATR